MSRRKYLQQSYPFVKEERKNAFPVLYGLLLIAVWAELEAFVEDLGAICLKHRPDAWKRKEFERIKAPVVEFLRLNDEERARWFFREIERELLKGKAGVVAFESLWELIGVPRPAEHDLKGTLIEMYAVRNVIVHRSGIADAAFKKASPKFPVAIGEPVKVNGARAQGYMNAVVEYAEDLMSRLFEWNGSPNKFFISGIDRLARGEKVAVTKRRRRSGATDVDWIELLANLQSSEPASQ